MNFLDFSIKLIEQQLNPNWAPDHKFARWFHLYEAVLKNTTQEVAEENGVPVYIQAPQSTLFRRY